MGIIHLEGMAFYGHHGYYTEERKRGNNYLIDVQFSYDLEKAAQTDDLGDAINYETVYDICRRQMEIPRHLIEALARSIAVDVKEQFPEVEYVRVQIKKLKPELGGPVNNAGVVYVL